MSFSCASRGIFSRFIGDGKVSAFGIRVASLVISTERAAKIIHLVEGDSMAQKNAKIE